MLKMVKIDVAKLKAAYKGPKVQAALETAKV
jgi:hypothetical protein